MFTITFENIMAAILDLVLDLVQPKSDITGRCMLCMATSTPNLAKISEIAAELWRFSFFSKWRLAGILDFDTGQK